MQNKMSELVGIFQRGSMEDKTKATEILSSLDPANSSKYTEALR